MAKTETRVLTAHVPVPLAEKVDQLADRLERSRGWVMKRTGMPRPPLLVGFVLCLPMERYLWISMTRYEWGWLLHPGVIVIGLISAALVLLGAFWGGKPGCAARFGRRGSRPHGSSRRSKRATK